MPSLTCFNYRFTPSYLMIVLALCFFILFCYLGFWQVSRGQEKKDMLTAYQFQKKQPIIDWRIANNNPKSYQPIKIRGRYLSTLFLLDNQHYKHQFGYHVISPVQLEQGNEQIILVDHGWVKGDITRKSFPSLTLPKNLQQIKGTAYYPSPAKIRLGPMIEHKNDGLILIEDINIKNISQILQKGVYPFIIRLDKNQKNGFVKEWSVVSMSPERHFAYALQWFVMAGLILIIFIVLNFKKKYV